MSAYERVTDALRDGGMRVTESPAGARSQCPVHGSRGLTLAVRPNPKNPAGPLHVTCFAGCDIEAVLAELGLSLRDLYDGDDRQHSSTPPRSWRKPNPWDALFRAYIDHDCLDEFFDKVNRHLDAERGA